MRRNAGFSLIEVMVVMAILAGLIGGVSVMILQGQRKQMEFRTKTRMTAIGVALDIMKDPNKFGMYPPTQAEQIIAKGTSLGKQLGTLNDKNQGIESVWVATHLAGLGSVPDGFDEEGSIKNTDDDAAVNAIPNMNNAKLMEFVDSWGNPFVYIHNRDYKSMQKVEQYVLGDGTTVKVAPRAGANGGFARESSFQLFSMGPDGIPGNEDDVHYGE